MLVKTILGIPLGIARISDSWAPMPCKYNFHLIEKNNESIKCRQWNKTFYIGK